MDKADPASALHRATVLALARVEGGQLEPVACLTAPDLAVSPAWRKRATADGF